MVGRPRSLAAAEPARAVLHPFGAPVQPPRPRHVDPRHDQGRYPRHAGSYPPDLRPSARGGFRRGHAARIARGADRAVRLALFQRARPTNMAAASKTACALSGSSSPRRAKAAGRAWRWACGSTATRWCPAATTRRWRARSSPICAATPCWISSTSTSGSNRSICIMACRPASRRRRSIARLSRRCAPPPGKVPVLSVLGRITDMADAEAALAAGVCDMVGAARQLIAEPRFVSNARHGLEAESRTCVACNWCTAASGDNAQGCMINPASYRERLWGVDTFTPAARAVPRGCRRRRTGRAGSRAGGGAARAPGYPVRGARAAWWRARALGHASRARERGRGGGLVVGRAGPAWRRCAAGQARDSRGCPCRGARRGGDRQRLTL